MATSGRMQSGVANYSYFYFQWQLAGQTEDGNYSTINWQAGVNISSGAWWGSNAIKIYGTYINGGGNVGSGTWSNISGNGDHQLLSGSYNIGHNADGGKAFSVFLDAWFFEEGDRDASASWDLPALYRYADPTNFIVNSVSDVSMTLRITTNRVVDNIAISLTGGGNWYYFEGATTDRTVTIGNAANGLASGKTFPVRISLRRQSSGFWKEAGNWNVTTAVQNKFFDLNEF